MQNQINSRRSHHNNPWWFFRSLAFFKYQESGHLLDDLFLAFVSVNLDYVAVELAPNSIYVGSVLCDCQLGNFILAVLMAVGDHSRCSLRHFQFQVVHCHLVGVLQHKELVRDYFHLLKGQGLKSGPWEPF